ncbi:uncharacterized protein LOC132618577 isoform X2 [Lycium barbarum]|nr:uncharacterized protein LOC132618577 isoform X2 [Lycium barbarum]XP_060189588.1 uncharacterized protein LOC132618577 isoform X2 [Lycium barbarum]
MTGSRCDQIPKTITSYCSFTITLSDELWCKEWSKQVCVILKLLASYVLFKGWMIFYNLIWEIEFFNRLILMEMECWTTRVDSSYNPLVKKDEHFHRAFIFFDKDGSV